MPKTRAEKLTEQVIDGLREYYPELDNDRITSQIKARVTVPDTGNDQKDYENVRDQVEAKVQDFIVGKED